MPIIRLDTDVSLIVPKEHKELMEKTEKLTKKIVELLNAEDEDYSVNAASIAFATLFFLRSATALDPDGAEAIREAIFEILSDGR